MRNIVLIFTFLFLLSCKNSESKTELEASKVKDINQIVQVVIIEDSLKVLKNGTDTRMLCKELTKLSVYVPEKTKDGVIPPPPPPSFNQISIEDLLHYRKSFYFSAKDSLSLLNQNSNPEKFKIEESLAEKINQTTKEKEINKKKMDRPFDFYEMTIPIFSLDNQKAYLELNHYCGGLCGSGISIYLRKINGKWKIVDKRQTWMS
ncbi:MAG: hypothetical protein KAX93_05825 [Flavobacterium sp.]|nr:hypothetical protein [Flavobacterium sp.]MBP8157877.1 hypothetical protein [Flavobacterium sp.]